MFKETVTYTDFNGNTRTEDLFFHLSKIEMMELETSVPGGLSQAMSDALESEDTTAMFGYIKDFIAKSYGIKSEDGRQFIKNEEILNEFVHSAVYDEFITSLLTDEKKMNSFIVGIIPEIPDTKSERMNSEQKELLEKFKNRQNEMA